MTQISFFKGEIAFNSGFGVAQSLLMKRLFELQPEALKMFHMVRILLSIAGKNFGSIKFKSFQIAILVFFFLQQLNLLPTVLRVQLGLEPAFAGGKALGVSLHWMLIILTF